MNMKMLRFATCQHDQKRENKTEQKYQLQILILHMNLCIHEVNAMPGSYMTISCIEYYDIMIEFLIKRVSQNNIILRNLMFAYSFETSIKVAFRIDMCALVCVCVCSSLLTHNVANVMSCACL